MSTTSTLEDIALSWQMRGFNCVQGEDLPGETHAENVLETDALFMVLEGSMELTVAGKALHPRQGEECFIPAGSPHRYRNTGTSSAVWLYGEWQYAAHTD